MKSLILFAKYFFPKANPIRAAALAVISGSIVLPAKTLLGLSAYQNSKLAIVKTIEYPTLENPNMFCAAVHPGMVDTAIFRKSGVTPDMLPMDDGELLFIHTPHGDVVPKPSNTPFSETSGGIHGVDHTAASSVFGREICLGKLGCRRTKGEG